MQNCKWTAKLVTLGIAVIALASSLAPSKAQAQENFAWITNTNGVTWKANINDLGNLELGSRYGDPEIAEIVVPKHVLIDKIDVINCVNLANIVIHPATAGRVILTSAPYLRGNDLVIFAGGSGLRTITCKQTMRDLIGIYLGYSKFQAGGWATFQRPVQWIELLPKMEIKTLSTDNGKELEVIWEDGTLQITDAVSGEWKDYNGNSPLRIPLWLAKPQQFFRIRKGDE